MKKETYFCDRCGKEIIPSLSAYSRYLRVIYTKLGMGHKLVSEEHILDLCEICQKSFAEWNADK